MQNQPSSPPAKKGGAGVWFLILVLVVAGLIYWNQQKGGEDNVVPTNTETKTEIPGGVLKLGVIMPLSGDAAIYGDNELKGVQIAVSEINAAGGVDGAQIELVVEDGKCNPEGGAAAGNKLVNVDMVKFIIGGACSGETLGFTTLTGENQVLSISPSATSPAITDAGAYVFRTAPSDALAGSIAANYAFTDLGAKTAAIIYETTDYAQGLEKTFKDTFTALGGEVVIDEGFATGDKDFTAQVLKTKNKMPDVVYVVPQSPATGILVIKQLKSTNVTSALLTAEVLASDTVLADNEVFLDGLTAIEPFYDQTAAKAAAFLASYKAENADPEFPFFTASAYSDVYLLAEAIEAVGYDTTKVAAYLTGLKNWSGALGTISFDANGDVLTSYAIKKADGGVYDQVKVVTP